MRDDGRVLLSSEFGASQKSKLKKADLAFAMRNAVHEAALERVALFIDFWIAMGCGAITDLSRLKGEVTWDF